jgi:hypothetical protein
MENKVLNLKNLVKIYIAIIIFLFKILKVTAGEMIGKLLNLKYRR